MRPISAGRNRRSSSRKSRDNCFDDRAGSFSGSRFFLLQGRESVASARPIYDRNVGRSLAVTPTIQNGDQSAVLALTLATATTTIIPSRYWQEIE